MMPTVGEEEEAGRPTAMRDNDDNKERGARAQAQAQGSGGGGCGVEEEEEVVVVVRETVDDVVTANANVNKLHHLLCLSASLIDKLHGEVRECSDQFSRELNELQQIADEQELLDAKLDSTLNSTKCNVNSQAIASYHTLEVRVMTRLRTNPGKVYPKSAPI
ncbi:hypothetical protein Pelo_18405 [Pelomyxa schiedti]|nr:hypothetical protein Pelo_18405 [Pelomyxa schiedti]